MNNNDKKGFTLVELLGIIVLLAIIGMIVFVVVDKNLKGGKQTAYNKQIKMIELAAENWANENIEQLPTLGKSVNVNLGALKMYGYVDLNVSDPITGLCFPNTGFVKISSDGETGKITYEINENSLKEGQTVCGPYDYKVDDKEPDDKEPEDKELDTCSPSPKVEITGGVSSIGNDQTTILKVVSNYKIEDKSKIYLLETPEPKELSERTTMAMGESIYNEEKKLYEIEVIITSGKSDYSEVKLVVEEKAIELNLEDCPNMYSERAESNLIMIINNLDLSNATFINDESGIRDDAGSYYTINGKNYFNVQDSICADPKGVTATWGEFDRYNELPAEYLDPTGEDKYHSKSKLIKDGVQFLKLFIPEIYYDNNSDIYNLYFYTYVDFEDADGNIKQMYRTKEEKWVIRDTVNKATDLFYSKYTKSPITYSELVNKFDPNIYTAHEIIIPVLINGNYHVTLCDNNDNCQTLDTVAIRNDCKPLTKNYEGSTASADIKLENLYKDEPSDETNGTYIDTSNNTAKDIYVQNAFSESVIGAIVLPTEDSVYEYMLLRGADNYNYYGFDFSNRYTSDELEILKIYNSSTLRGMTLQTLRNKINEGNLPYCNNTLYIYFQDNAGNLSEYSEYLGENTDLCSSSSTTGDDACDLECQIKRNNFACRNYTAGDKSTCYQEANLKNSAICNFAGEWSSNSNLEGCYYIEDPNTPNGLGDHWGWTSSEGNYGDMWD